MKHLGYLIIYRLADVSVPYTALEALAQQTGFPHPCLPTPPTPYNAWQKATNLKRQKLIPPAALVESIQTQYNCAPIVQAESKIVSTTIRHILRSVTIPGARTKNAQVDVEPVAVLKFDENGLSDEEKFVSSYPHDDPLAAVNGNVDCLIHRMKLEYQRQLTTADGQDIRAGVRRHLETLEAILLSDGTYFTVAATGLAALQDYILALAPYRRGDGPITCQVYPVLDDGSALAEQNKIEIAAAAAAQFNQALTRILEQVQPDGRGVEATKARLRKVALALGMVQEQIGSYEQALGSLGLDRMIGRCRQVVEAAKGEEDDA